MLLPIALAVRQLLRRQPRRLGEALLTGLLTVIVLGFANGLLRSGGGTQLYDAITMSRPGASHIAALDAYLAGLAAYATIIDLSAWPRWRNALWLAFGVYAIASLAVVRTTVLSLLITLLLGRAIGLAVRYAAGSMSQRPTAEAIAAALSSACLPVTEMRRVPESGVESRRYAAALAGGAPADRVPSRTRCATRSPAGRRCRWTGQWSAGRSWPTLWPAPECRHRACAHSSG